jgi:Fur family ferric uptake transcriptional regulator
MKSVSIKQFEEKFADAGLIFTSQRRAIAETLINLTNHPDVEEIFFKVKKIDKTASIATVYRTINLFVELGLTSKRDFKDSKSRYEITAGKEHNHIIVEGGEILEFTNQKLEALIEQIVKEKNLELKDYVIEIYCKKKS